MPEIKQPLGTNAQNHKIWRCDVCGKESIWCKPWRWMPEKLSADEMTRYDPQPTFITCSDACRIKYESQSPQST